MKIRFLILTVFILSSCVCKRAPILTHVMKNEFNVKQAQQLMKKGNNTIIGNAFIRQNGGGVVTCAGSRVSLVPATSYAEERLKYLYSGTEKGYNPIIFKGCGQFGLAMEYNFTPSPDNYTKLTKETVCDSSGHFKFNNVSEGEFFITTNVIWQVPSTTSYTMVPNGGTLMQKVILKKGETKEIIMSR